MNKIAFGGRRVVTRMLCVLCLIVIGWAGASFAMTERAWSQPSAGSIPSEVLRSTWRFRFVHPYILGTDGGQTVEHEYASWFFDGYLCSRACTTENATTLETDAYAAGASLRGDHPEGFDRVMSGFGYRRVDVVGVWSHLLERSVFATPSAPREPWYLRQFDSDVEDKNGSPIFWGDNTVRVVGYLSPKREGPEGRYREIWAQSITAFHD